MVWLPNMANFGRYPMHRFSENEDDLKGLCLYLNRGQNPNQEVLGSSTLLHVAAQSYRKNDKVVQKLIDAGADTELTTSMGYTPLQYAVISRNRGAVRKLIQAGVQINTRNVFGKTALHYAIYTCQPRNMLIRYTWMHILRSTLDVGIIKMLLDHDDTDVNPVDSQGETPLMWAVKYGSLSAVKLLLKRGANPNILNKQAQNSLHVALSVQNPSEDIITELLRNGTGIYNMDCYGQTPVDIFIQNAVTSITSSFAVKCVQIIAIKYRVRRDLENKLRRIPLCSSFLGIACEDLQWMRKEIIWDKTNLHDFASGCFQERGKENNLLQIYLKVIQTLFSRKPKVYFHDLFYRIPSSYTLGLFSYDSPMYEPVRQMMNYFRTTSCTDKCLS